MNGKQILHSLFPQPRSPIVRRDALPLVLFLSAFAALCFWLEWSDRLMFARPAAFTLMVVCVWVWWMQVAGFSGLGPTRGRVALVIRLMLVAAFVMLLAEPRAVRTRDVLSVVYALDVSDSIGEGSTDQALEFVAKTVYEKPPKDEAGLIVFGRNAAVELPPRISFPFEAINSRIDRDATNLEQSLSLAAAMLPEENRGRIVLISDGTETEGNLSQILGDLKSREIAVDVLPIQYDYDDEVWIERLELPRFVKIGENYEASIVVSSLKAGNGKLLLRENGKVIAEQPVDFQAGKNRYVVPIYLREAGYYEYSATIELPRGKDQLLKNNTVLNYLFVAGEGKVLVVTDPQGDDRDWKPLVKAIREGKRAAEVQTPFNFARDSLSLMPYDCVVFVNVAADAFDTVQMRALRNAVYDQGIGFLMVGGANSFGPGGYHRTSIEEALPVTMDITKKKVLPKGALAIILHTCEFGEGNTWAKKITKQAIKVLGAQDEVGVLAYTEKGASWIFELTKAGEYESMVPKINAAQIGDMPSFADTMQLGLVGLKASDAATRHMIIISDGDPSPPPPSMISDFKKSQISVSMVAIFPHGGQDISKMRIIAEITGGRYYFPDDPALLPSIFIKEAKTLKRSMIQNKTVYPDVSFTSPVLKGIDAMPPLHGYVLTTAKPRAKPILTVQPDEEQVDDIDPLLATWRYGLGTTAAFTSDLSPNWGKDWVDWDKYRAFVTQLMTNISRVRKEGHLRMWNYASGNQGMIMVEDFHPEESFLEVQARVSGPRDRSETVRLKQIGPRRYRASVPLWGKGRYQVMAVGVAGERTDRALGGFIIPYSPEYLRFRSNPIILEEIAEQTGGQRLNPDSKAEVIYGRRNPKQSSRPIFDWFLFALACLIPLDVGIRRIQIDLSVIKGWLGIGRKRTLSTEMMGTLLKRKQQVDLQLEKQRVETPFPIQPTAATIPRKSTRKSAPQQAPEKQPAPESKGDEGDSSSTTSRLLQMKRRRDQDQEDP